MNPDFGSQTITTTGNITVSGTVDGRDVSTDGSKLDGIETAATADQTAAEVKSLYESNSDTNNFTDAEKTFLSDVSATATEINYTTNVTSDIQSFYSFSQICF